jgi:ribosomal protein S18 acetylase RimI-like enzyme
MTVLSPMRQQAYAAYLESSVAAYAEDNIAAGRWPRGGAVDRSRASYLELLPQGLATPDNYLYEIMADQGGPIVGVIWFAVETRHGVRTAFVYDLEIEAAHRRQGHARGAFLALEQLVAALGLSSIGLHVFARNHAAQALYSRLGYVVTGINMVKRIAESG